MAYRNRNNFEVHMQGLENISGRILALPDEARKKVVQPAIRDGAKVIRNAVKERAERMRHTADSSTHIFPNVIFQTYTDRKNGNIFGKVGVAGGARYRRGDRDAGLPTYWRYVEFGTFNDDGSVRTRPQPFMRTGMNDSINTVFSQVVYDLSRNFYRL